MTLGCAASSSTIASALSQCRSMRSASVRTPRSTSQASKGPGIAPIEFWCAPRRAAMPASLVSAAPPTTSLCPPRYLVVECTTTSAPSASGCWRYGVAKVLSTTRIAPARGRARPTAARSQMRSIGFVGVSTHTTRVVARPQRRRQRVEVRHRDGRVLETPRARAPCRRAGTSRRRRRRGSRRGPRSRTARAAPCRWRPCPRRTRSRARRPRGRRGSARGRCASG